MSKPADRIKFDVPQKSAAERKKMKKLGKGLGALMSETKREEPLVASPAQNSATGYSDQALQIQVNLQNQACPPFLSQ